MSKLFGGKNPFDDPFFTEPFGGWNYPFDGQPDTRKQITIEELNPEDYGGQAQENAEPRKDLVVKNKKPSKKSNGSHSFSYRRVAYGGLNGMYYTCSEGRMIGPDGVVLAEMEEDDKTVGESLHTISKGIHNKGHSVTTKHSSDGRGDTLQTLHNLNEDELGDFEQNWKATADKYLPGWDKCFSLLENQDRCKTLLQPMDSVISYNHISFVQAVYFCPQFGRGKLTSLKRRFRAFLGRGIFKRMNRTEIGILIKSI